MLIDINDIKGIVYLGIQGENNVADIDIDCTSWLATFPTGVLSVQAQRPKETTIYLADTNTDSGIITWHVGSYDTYIAGNGTFQVRLDTPSGENIKISEIIRTLIRPSQSGTIIPEPPLPTPSWVDEVLAAAASAEQSAKDIEDLTVSSHLLASEASPTVTKTKPTDQPYNLDFGLPDIANLNFIQRGFYKDDNFYTDSTYTTELPKGLKYSYIDKNTQNVYTWDGEHFYQPVEYAKATAAGIMKLYNEHGSNIDGTMTQQSISTGVENIKFTIDENDSECLVLNAPW